MRRAEVVNEAVERIRAPCAEVRTAEEEWMVPLAAAHGDAIRVDGHVRPLERHGDGRPASGGHVGVGGPAGLGSVRAQAHGQVGSSGEEQRAAHAAPGIGGEEARILAAAPPLLAEAEEERGRVDAVDAGDGVHLGRCARRAGGERRAEGSLRPARATHERGAGASHGIRRTHALRLVEAEARARFTKSHCDAQRRNRQQALFFHAPIIPHPQPCPQPLSAINVHAEECSGTGGDRRGPCRR